MDSGKQQSRPNPRQTANPVSALLFWWTVQLFREGYTKEITVDDLYRPLDKDASQVLGDRLERQWSRQVERAQRKGTKPSLMRALFRTFGYEYCKLGMVLIVNEVFRLGQPLLLGGLLAYFKPSSTMERSEAVLYATGIVLFTALTTIAYNHYVMGAFHTGMRIRASCCSLIYRKSLRLSRTALGETAAGQVVNLLSNDVSRFELVTALLHYMWSAPIMAAIVAYFMWTEIGASCFVGISVVFVVAALQAYTGKLTAYYRRKTAYKTDKRVRLMDEIVSGIQVIKMYAWEKPFSKIIMLARKLEINVIMKTSYIRGIYMTFNLSTTRLAVFCTLVCMVLTEETIAADKVFVVLSYFNILAQTMSMMFVRAVQEIAETYVSISRLQDFMMHDEFISAKSPLGMNESPTLSEKKKKTENGFVVAPSSNSNMVVLDNATAKWDPSTTDDTLSAVNVTATKGKLVVVVGQVGAGKSSLLQAVLGELPLSEGKCTVRGRVSYACQEPWVFGATVRQNITFGRPYDRRRYNEVVRVCALQRDLEQFPSGDKTVVGERGSSLSGGQKARINLARAVYNDADIYLLDDPLSAVDTHVGKHLLEECINTFLAKKTRILVTHQLQYLSEADHIVILNNGRVEVQGTFQSLASTVDYAELMGLQEGTESTDDSVDDQSEGDSKHSPIHRILRQISTKSKSSEHDVKEDGKEGSSAALEQTEESSKGKTGEKSLYLAYFRSGTNYCVIGLVILLFVLSQASASAADYFLAYWTTREELRTAYGNETSNQVNTTGTFTEEDLNQNEVNTTGNFTGEDLNQDEFNQVEFLSTNSYIYIYTAIIVFMFSTTLTRSFTFYKVGLRCSEKLHHAMFSSIIRTRLRFFDVNPSGRILNRFSKDIGSIDELLPKALLDATQILMMMTGCLVVSVSVNYLFLLPIVFMSGIFWFVRRVFLKTSRNVKRVEGITKSPVFTHLHATLQGLTTIRAYGAQDILKEEFDRHQDLHTSASYMFVAAGSAFGFSLDFLCLIFIAVVTFSFLHLDAVFSGDVGLVITQCMALTGMIQWGMRQSAEISNQMMSVERILEYSALEEEPNLETSPAKKPPGEWPSAGQIEFVDVYMKYTATDKPVLKDLNLLIEPKEKIGIVGRTGAGKSSLISALFRLAWVEGEVLIDGVDTKNVTLQELRTKISIIPQDPVLFSGTMRKNLDPFEEYPDSALWKAIEEVELKDALHESYGLQTKVSEGGSNFSVGQKQLVCLARAILRNNKILMLDEATANVDPHTDSLIQETIRVKFKDCTVLTVAHRLNTIMDTDKVLVMEAGKMVEFNHPHILLQDTEGYFYKMVQQTGKVMADQLAKIAEENYKTIHS